MRKSFSVFLGAISGVALMASSAMAAGCGKVSITEMNWASSQIITEVSKFLMEQGYGCKVTKVPSATTTAVASLAENGEPDIVTELWLNSSGDVYKKMEAAGKVERLAEVISPWGIRRLVDPRVFGKKTPRIENRQRCPCQPKIGRRTFQQLPRWMGLSEGK